MADRPEADAIREEPDVAEKLLMFARGAAVRSARSARVQLAIRNGAVADPAVAELWSTILDQRLVGMTRLAEHLHATGQLRVGLDRTRDVLWTCISVEVYDLLVLQRGWSDTAYAEWLADTLVASLT